MNENDLKLGNLLDSTELDAIPDPARVQAVRERTMNLAHRSAARRPRARVSFVAALMVIGLVGIGMAATETGRSLLGLITTPIQENAVTEWVAPDGTVWSRTSRGRSEPYSVAEEDAVANEFAEYHAIKQAGGGRLVGLIESPGFMIGMTSHTIFQIAYAMQNGEDKIVGSGRPTAKQAENLRIDEIMELRDAGAGEIVEQQPLPIGLGRYTIRLTLSDGETIDLQTTFPPSTREERERIFAEMHKLRAQLLFSVLDPYVDPEHPERGVWGILQYTLADGRTVGATSRVPPEAISEDGTQVVLPDLVAPIAIQGASESEAEALR